MYRVGIPQTDESSEMIRICSVAVLVQLSVENTCGI